MIELRTSCQELMGAIGTSRRLKVPSKVPIPHHPKRSPRPHASSIDPPTRSTGPTTLSSPAAHSQVRLRLFLVEMVAADWRAWRAEAFPVWDVRGDPQRRQCQRRGPLRKVA